MSLSLAMNILYITPFSVFFVTQSKYLFQRTREVHIIFLGTRYPCI